MMFLRRFPSLLLAGLLLGSASPAPAAPGPEGGRLFKLQARREVRREAPEQHWHERQELPRSPAAPGADNPERRSWEEGRDARREERRQWLNSRQVEGGGRSGESNDAGRRRLSPEERQRLRQDINEAGRDMYPRDGRPPFQRP